MPVEYKIFLITSKINKLKNFLNHKKISVAVDESCNVRDIAKLVLWVHFCLKRLPTYKQCCQFIAEKNWTHGIDTFESFPSLKEEFSLDMKT